jgi:hypothetical protein
MGQALGYAAVLGLVRCNPEAVANYGQALADIVSRYDLPAFWVGWVTFLPNDRPNHVGIAVQRHLRAGRIQERDGKMYGT